MLFQLSGCRWFTEPVGFVLPPPDPSLDPSALRDPVFRFLCGTWVDSIVINRQLRPVPQPSEPWVLIDVAFGRLGPSDPPDRLTPEHRSVIKRHGGQVLYPFHFPAARIWIPTRNVPGLSTGARSTVSIFYVRDPSRYDWPVGVNYKRPYSFRDGEPRFAALGGRVDYRFDVINSLAGLLPDRSVAALRADSEVAFVEASPAFPFCTA